MKFGIVIPSKATILLNSLLTQLRGQGLLNNESLDPSWVFFNQE